MCRLLILDDDFMFCDLIKSALDRSASALNLHIHTTTLVDQAVALVRQAVEDKQPFDILLIDQRLDSYQDGIEVMQQLRQLSPDSDAIILTGMDDAGSGQRAYAAGAFRYLPKIFDTRELIYILQSLIHWRKIHLERERFEILNEIGRQVTGRAVQEDLEVLLEEVRMQIGRRMDVRNFIVVLVDDDIQQLDFRLHYENNLRVKQHFLPMHAGLSGHLISINDILYLPTGIDAYRAEHAIQIHGFPAKCWVGVPLRVENRVIGAIILQNYEQEYAISNADVQFLVAVADQISGAIQATRMAEQERIKAQSLSILPRASTEMMKWANLDENNLWFMLLSLATANWGFRFNRCWLFLVNPSRSKLNGKLGIGHIDPEAARTDWERDVNDRMTFDTFMRNLKNGRLRHNTPLETLTPRVVFKLDNGSDAFSQVVRDRKGQIVPAAEASSRLPADFVKVFHPAECAVLPVRAANEIIGVAVVDNKFDGKAIDMAALDHLETFLNMAGLIWDNVHNRKSHDALLDATYAIMGQVGNRPLTSTLHQICSAARTVTGADWTIIYPFKPGSTDYEYDVVDVGYAGEKPVPTQKDKPRLKGVTGHIMRTGKLVVPDLQAETLRIAENPLREHPFLLKNNFQAFIGLPVRDAGTFEQLGVMYLDYLTVRTFSDADVQRAESFANLAATAIRNARQAEQVNTEMTVAREQGQASQRELEIYQHILQAALLTDDEEVIIRALLDAVPRVINQSNLLSIITMHTWSANEKGEMVEDYRFYTSREQINPLGRATGFNKNLAASAIKSGETQASRTQRQLYVPIRHGLDSSGVIYLQQSRQAIVTPDQQSALERLASIASLALDGVRRQNHLRVVLDAARYVTGPNGLKETLNAIIRSVHAAVPEISALTLWYFDPEANVVRVGPCFGVRSTNFLGERPPEQSSIVWQIMNSQQPIYAENVLAEPRLVNKFVQREDIVSAAAFPLMAENKSVGAMFFNYRLPHHFNHEERLLFPLLTEIVAASISDAIQLESLRKQREQRDAALVITRAVGASLEINQIIHTVLTELRNLLQQTNTTPCLLLYNEDEQLLEFAPSSWEFYQIDNPEYLGLKSMPLDSRSIACRVARETLMQRQPVTHNGMDTNDDQDYLRLITSTQSELCASLVSGERLLGVLVLESPQAGAFGDDDVRLVESVAQQVSIAIERAQQTDQLRFTNTVAAATAWAADLAHDINREVGVIRTSAYWIGEECQDKEQILEYCRLIDDSASRLAITGTGNSDPTTFVLDKNIEQILKNAIGYTDKNIRFDFHPGCHGVNICTSRIQLRRVLHHLGRNAMEAMRGQAERRLIASTHLLDSGMAEIIIQDNGPGIAEGTRSSIFQRPVTTKRRPGGFGLMFVRQMVEGMGGSIRLLPPEPGCGAAFSIRLPIMQKGLEGVE